MVVARGHYTRTHAFAVNEWGYWSHAVFLLCAGGFLALVGARRKVEWEMNLFALAVAVGLALADVFATTVFVYKIDLVAELLFSSAWSLLLADRGSKGTPAGRHNPCFREPRA